MKKRVEIPLYVALFVVFAWLAPSIAQDAAPVHRVMQEESAGIKNVDVIEKPLPDYLKETEQIWDKTFASGWREEQGPDKFLMDFIKGYQAKIGKMGLDLGCGWGRNLIPLLEQGFNVIGLDISKEGLKKAKEKLEERKLATKLIHGESTKLRFDSESFDFVVSLGVLHHQKWEDIQKSFREINRVLRRDGYLIFSVRSASDTERPRQRIVDYGHTAIDIEGSKKGVVQHYFTKEELLKLAQENQFEVIVEPSERNRIRESGRKRARWQAVFRKR